MASIESQTRLSALRRLLTQEKLSTQDELREELRALDFDVTQSTVSRDLRRHPRLDRILDLYPGQPAREKPYSGRGRARHRRLRILALQRLPAQSREWKFAGTRHGPAAFGW